MRDGRTIRNIHDAIDTLVRRKADLLRESLRKAKKEQEARIYEELGVNELIARFKALTGDKPNIHVNADSTLGMALGIKEDRYGYPRECEPKEIEALYLLAENAHIKVVAGDKLEVLSELKKSLGLD